MYLLGFDIGSSSIKASLINGQTGECIASGFSPKQEMDITAIKTGWAEQHTDLWWKHLKIALQEVLTESKVKGSDIKAIGISYQMHGMVILDHEGKVLRPSIIWCDSRAVDIGNKAFHDIGEQKCLSTCLNSPGNFTASKIRWVKENEPDIFDKIYKVMLPGDYIAYKLTGNMNTTISGLSEGIFWDFKEGRLAETLFNYYGISTEFIPDIVPTFSEQGKLTQEAASELGLSTETQVTYRAGDQPNNAFSLNVLNPGEIAATAGTSGVVYGVSGEIKYDPKSRVNTFAHVNHDKDNIRLGVLLCVNGTGILNSWTRKNIASGVDYPEMNAMAEKIPIGSEGLIVMPFGNGAERMLGNINTDSSFRGINFNIHKQDHIYRAVQEGIVFSLKYGMDIMAETGIKPAIIKAGKTNMFLSKVFRDTLAGITGATIELYNTDGSVGAAKGAGVGIGFYNSFTEAFSTLDKLEETEPDVHKKEQYQEAYNNWNKYLINI